MKENSFLDISKKSFCGLNIQHGFFSRFAVMVITKMTPIVNSFHDILFCKILM